MDWAIVAAIITILLLMFLSVLVSKRFSAIVFSVVFLGGAAFITTTSDRENLLANILIMGFVLTIVWLRINKSFTDYSRAREQLLNRLNNKRYTICKVCGSQLLYHRKPKNVSQLMLGGLTCQNCGAESNIPLDVFFSR